MHFESFAVNTQLLFALCLCLHNSQVSYSPLTMAFCVRIWIRFLRLICIPNAAIFECFACITCSSNWGCFSSISLYFSVHLLHCRYCMGVELCVYVSLLFGFSFSLQALHCDFLSTPFIFLLLLCWSTAHFICIDWFKNLHLFWIQHGFKIHAVNCFVAQVQHFDENVWLHFLDYYYQSQWRFSSSFFSSWQNWLVFALSMCLEFA